MINLKDEKAISRLIKASREEREKRATNWRKFLSEFIGSRWRSGVGAKRSSNQVHTYVETFMAVLMFAEPEVKWKARFEHMNQIVADVMSKATQHSMSESKVIEEIERCVFDSLIAFGVMKTGLQPGSPFANVDSAMIDGSDGPFDPLLPFGERISPFDFLWDDTAKHWRQWQWCGHEFERDLEAVFRDPRYKIPDGLYPESVKVQANQRHEGMSKRGDKWKADMREAMPDVANLAELYFAFENRIVTLIEVTPDQWVIIRNAPFLGPEDGPYHLLGYQFEGDSSIPISPMSSWWQQWAALEAQEFDLTQQVKEEKTVVAFPKTAKKSAQLLKEARDHSFVVGIDEPGVQLTYGGATEQKIFAVADARQRFEHASGMSDIMRGVPTRGEQTATAVTLQDRYSNIRLEKMGRRVTSFAKEIIRDFGWFHFYDPSVASEVEVQVGEDGPGAVMVRVYMRGGDEIDPETGQPYDALDLVDFYLVLDHNSFRRKDGPLERMQAMQEGEFLFAAVAPLALTLGYMPDVTTILRNIGERIGWDSMEKTFVPMSPVAQMMWFLSNVKLPTPGQTQGQSNTKGSKTGTGAIPGGLMGQIMRNVMKGSQTMGDAGRMAQPMGDLVRSG